MTPEPLSVEQLQAIAARVDAATPGPWRSEGVWFEIGEPGGHGFDNMASEEDAAFIAHARSDIPRLLAEVERLQTVVERLEKAGLYWQRRFRAASRELVKEISEARGLTYRQADQIALELIDRSFGLRTRRRDEEEGRER
jgi:hypothetical protein